MRSGLARILRYPRAMSNAAVERLRLAIEMADAGIALMRQNLKRRFPNESDEQIDRRLSAWLRERPGADDGDAPGVRRSWTDR